MADPRLCRVLVEPQLLNLEPWRFRRSWRKAEGHRVVARSRPDLPRSGPLFSESDRSRLQRACVRQRLRRTLSPRRLWIASVALLALAAFAMSGRSSAAAGWSVPPSDAANPSAPGTLAAAATATQTVVVLPGQALVEGSGISGTPATQTAGAAFTADVYAVDASFNIDPSATGALSLATSDPNDVEPGPADLVNGHAAFR